VCCDYDINTDLPQAAKIRKYPMSDPIKNTIFLYTLRNYEICLWIIFVLIILLEYNMQVYIEATEGRDNTHLLNIRFCWTFFPQKSLCE